MEDVFIAFFIVVVVVTLIKHNDQGNLKKREFMAPEKG